MKGVSARVRERGGEGGHGDGGSACSPPLVRANERACACERTNGRARAGARRA